MAEIKVCDVTEGKIDGAGAFDQFMASHVSYLEQEYKKQRIKGTEYSNAYLAGIQPAMAQAVAFVLGEQAADKQADLLAEQILKTRAEIDLINKQIEKIDKEIELMDEQNNLTKAQVWAERAKVSDTPDSAILVPNAIQAESIFGANIAKIGAEVELLEEKTVSESAQTKPISDPESVLGKQIAVSQKQIYGYDRDSEQKMSKILSDAYAVRKSADEDATTPTELNDGAIDDFVQYAANKHKNSATP